MNKTVFALAAAVLAFSTSAYAESKAEILRIIEQTPSEYCGIEIQNINIIYSAGNKYVLYTTHGYTTPNFPPDNCSGGSGSYHNHLVKLERVNGQLQLSGEDLLENLNMNTRFISDMQIKNGIWTFTSKEYRKDDANCCPSKLYLNQVRLSDMKVLSRKFIGLKRN